MALSLPYSIDLDPITLCFSSLLHAHIHFPLSVPPRFCLTLSLSLSQLVSCTTFSECLPFLVLQLKRLIPLWVKVLLHNCRLFHIFHETFFFPVFEVVVLDLLAVKMRLRQNPQDTVRVTKPCTQKAQGEQKRNIMNNTFIIKISSLYNMLIVEHTTSTGFASFMLIISTLNTRYTLILDKYCRSRHFQHLCSVTRLCQ